MNVHSPRTRALILTALGVLYTLFVLPLWGWTYWDFGDGNYLYVGKRILDGAVPYRDILAPQPPLHLIGAALSQAFGRLVFDSELIGARFYALVVRLLGAGMVYLAARMYYRCDFRATVAAAVYLALPIGFWWSLCVQSENLELVFLMFAMAGILTLDRRWMIPAGIASGLAMHCNMTALPYFLCNALFLGVRRPKLFLWYAPAALGTWGIGIAAAYAWAGPDYLSNVITNQVGSFPRTDILAATPGPPNSFVEYAIGKVVSQGREVLRLEGPLILLGIGALAVRWREEWRAHDHNSDAYRRWEYFAWYCIGMLLSIGFVMKGGTVNYIFVLGEPAVALLAADAIVRLSRFAARSFTERPRESRRTILGTCGMVVVLIALLWPPALENANLTLRTLQSELPGQPVTMEVETETGATVTVTTNSVAEIREIIEAHSEPGDPILAPPFYAWATDRLVAAELAENYLWNIKFMNESFDGIEGEGVLKMRELAAMLRRQEVPLVLLDQGQTGSVPVIRDALARFYEPLDPPTYRTRHVELLLMVPRE